MKAILKRIEKALQAHEKNRQVQGVVIVYRGEAAPPIPPDGEGAVFLIPDNFRGDVPNVVDTDSGSVGLRE